MNQKLMMDQITREESGKKQVDRAQAGEVWRRIRRYLAGETDEEILRIFRAERKAMEGEGK